MLKLYRYRKIQHPTMVLEDSDPMKIRGRSQIDTQNARLSATTTTETVLNVPPLPSPAGSATKQEARHLKFSLGSV